MERPHIHKASSCLLSIVLLMVVAHVCGQGAPGDAVPDINPDHLQFQQANTKPQVGPPASLMRDKNHIQDREHIMEHLDGYIDLEKPESEMTEKELQLHYFKLHDYDNNQKLDGLELLQAMTHYHHDGSPTAQPLKEEDLINLIDPILRDDDRNNDGFIDYPEYAATQVQ